MTDFVISGLIRRRRELAGVMFEHLAKADSYAADIAAIDHTPRLFDPAKEPDALPSLQSRPQPDWALRGEVVRAVFALLKDSQAPLSTDALVAAVNASRGIEGDITLVQRKRMRKCLERQRAKGTLRAVQIAGRRHWTLG